ncbi:MAG: undecaprenyl/decaprenyl-phosphate alpha-N-acetylglucosaminyl 1-phosphate transferase, partial [Firmicutes bacterium]|nr:undecaprenyl/decaprenyl-phosphate alpha-N-acetylglucosaminyl 1-phosphate transferase [Bacillota bacterium]
MTGAPFPPILALFLPAAAVALAGTWASVFLARRLGAMDPPGGDLKIHPRPIPRLGGLGVGAGVLAALL